MAINKKLIHFDTFTNFNSKRLSANKENTQYTIGISDTIYDVEEGSSVDILYQSIVFIKDTQQQWTHGLIYKSVSWSVLKRQSKVVDSILYLDSIVDDNTLKLNSGTVNNNILIL